MTDRPEDDPLAPARAALDAAEDIEVAPGEDADAPHPGSDDDGSGGDGPDAFEDKLPEGARFPLNDIGNGQRFVLYHGADLIRVPRLAWHAWTGTCWAKDEDELAVRRRAQTISALTEREIPYLVLSDWQMAALEKLDADEAELKRLDAIKDPSDEERAARETVARRVTRGRNLRSYLSKLKQEHRRFAKSTGNTGKIDAMLKEAGITLARALDDLDADPLAVNCEAGTIRFGVTRADGASPVAELRLDPHDPEDLITKCIPARFDPEDRRPLSERAPRFDDFLTRIMPSAEMRGFIQRWFGLSMSGVPVQKLAFFYGHGANGKSVLVDLMCRILDSYSATAPIEALTGQSRRGGSDATPELIPLIGARTVRASEPEQGERFKEGMIKALTSGEPIAVRALHSDFIFIKPFFKLTISGNHKPEIRGTDDGIWRRVMLVPFDVQIPESERDPDLGEKLWEERDGILSWMVDGLLQYLEGGLQVPTAIAAATDSYRKDSDPMGAFLTDATLVTGDPGDFTPSRELVDAFKFWMTEEGETPWGDRTVSLRLKEKADRWVHPDTQSKFTTGKMKVTGYRGIRLKDTFAARMREGAGGSGYGGPGEASDW